MTLKDRVELVTLRSEMSVETFNRVLDLVQAEFPSCELVVEAGVVHVMSHPEWVAA